MYGFIRLTRTEERIINSPFYQRLRWIKQLGFANYIFPGAEHTRFAHAIGVMHSVDQMIRSIGRHAPDEKLFDPRAMDRHTAFHKICRVAALLHDIGTFPFSHTVEEAYIRENKRSSKDLPNNHEHLGSYIVKNTYQSEGLTKILEDDGFDCALLSKYIKGESSDFLANQLLHSDLDADRLDYLVRDARHTGIQYGHIDRDYILFHLTVAKNPKSSKPLLCIRENAIHAVDDFLMARFAWYSQVVKNPTSGKFDVLAAHIAKQLLNLSLLIPFSTLLENVKESGERFFGFNDFYFMNLLHEVYWSNSSEISPSLKEQVGMLLFRKSPITIRIKEFEHQLFDSSSGTTTKTRLLARIDAKVKELNKLLEAKGQGKAWLIVDLPSKDVVFSKKNAHPLEDRDGIKVQMKNGSLKPLYEVQNSTTAHLHHLMNFIPNLYGNEKAYEILKAHRIIG